MAEAGWPPEFYRKVALVCEATVGGEKLQVRIEMPEAAYADEAAREHIESLLRYNLMQKILEKWTPVIRVIR